MDDYVKKSSYYPDYEEPSSKNRRNAMRLNLDEYVVESLNMSIYVFGAFFGASFLTSIAISGNLQIIVFGLLSFLFLLLFWFINRKQPTRNSAFEKHQDEAAQNMKKERNAFIKFLEQEQKAEDSAAFAKFMKSKP